MIPASLGEGVAHLWALPLDRSEEERLRLEKLLSRDERDRANRFHFPRDRNRWICARALLRQTLSLYLNMPPRALEFAQGEFGKPCLAGLDVESPDRLSFNLSHSEELAVVAIARGCEVGADIEKVPDSRDRIDVLRVCLSPEEQPEFDGEVSPERIPQLLAHWVCKEAYLKARGEGLLFTHPNELTVVRESQSDPNRARIVRQDDTSAAVTLVPLEPGFVCAVAGVDRLGLSVLLSVEMKQSVPNKD